MKKFVCPFCKSPSFIMDSQSGNYFCFSCGMGGDVVSYRHSVQHKTYKDAALSVGKKLFFDERKSEDEERILEALEAAKKYYASSNNPAKVSYLKKRKMSDSTIAKFEIGYSDDALLEYLAKKGISEDAIEKAGLLSTDEKGKKYAKFWKRVMFPIHDEFGKTIGFGGRVLDDSKPKYLNSPESLVFDKSHNLYALDIAKNTKKDFFLLCEGYVDVITLHQNGFDNAVASLGTSFTAGQAELMHKYKSSVYIVYDSDEPGQKAIERAIQIVEREGMVPKVISVAPFKDVDEFLVNKGAVEFQKRIDAAESALHFLAKGKTADEILAIALTEIKNERTEN